MDSSLIHADHGTQVRMAIVTLLASTLVVWIGISARVASTTWPAAPRIEAPALPASAARVRAATGNSTALDVGQDRSDARTLWN